MAQDKPREEWTERLRLRVNFDKNQDREVCILFIKSLLRRQREQIREEIEGIEVFEDQSPNYALQLVLDLPSLAVDKEETAMTKEKIGRLKDISRQYREARDKEE